MPNSARRKEMDSTTAGSNGPGPGRVSVTVPGEDRYLELLRVTVGRAARISGFTYSGIEDFSLAVDEAAVLLLGERPAELTLRMADRDGKITAVVSIHGPEVDWPPTHDLSADLRWQVLNALCEQVWLVEGNERGIGLAQTIR